MGGVRSGIRFGGFTGTTITGTSSVTFNSTVDSQAGENNDLTVTSPATPLKRKP